VGGDVEECLGFGGKGRCFADNLETCHVRNQGFRLRRLQVRHKFADGAQIVCRVSRQKVGLVHRDAWPSQSSDVREAVVADSRHVASSTPDSPSTSAMRASLEPRGSSKPCRFSRGQALNTKHARKITSANTSANLDMPASAFHLKSGELKRGRATHNYDELQMTKTRYCRLERLLSSYRKTRPQRSAMRQHSHHCTGERGTRTAWSWSFIGVKQLS
jgi:hypothetical protein